MHDVGRTAVRPLRGRFQDSIRLPNRGSGRRMCIESRSTRSPGRLPGQRAAWRTCYDVENPGGDLRVLPKRKSKTRPQDQDPDPEPPRPASARRCARCRVAILSEAGWSGELTTAPRAVHGTISVLSKDHCRAGL